MKEKLFVVTACVQQECVDKVSYTGLLYNEVSVMCRVSLISSVSVNLARDRDSAFSLVS